MAALKGERRLLEFSATEGKRKWDGAFFGKQRKMKISVIFTGKKKRSDLLSTALSKVCIVTNGGSSGYKAVFNNSAQKTFGYSDKNGISITQQVNLFLPVPFSSSHSRHIKHLFPLTEHLGYVLFLVTPTRRNAPRSHSGIVRGVQYQ